MVRWTLRRRDVRRDNDICRIKDAVEVAYQHHGSVILPEGWASSLTVVDASGQCGARMTTMPSVWPLPGHEWKLAPGQIAPAPGC